MNESVPNSDVRKIAKMEKWRKIKMYVFLNYRIGNWVFAGRLSNILVNKAQKTSRRKICFSLALYSAHKYHCLGQLAYNLFIW